MVNQGLGLKRRFEFLCAVSPRIYMLMKINPRALQIRERVGMVGYVPKRLKSKP